MTGLLAVSCTSAGSSSSTTAGGQGTAPVAGDAEGEVTWIADGDTIDVDTVGGTITVRLVAINAPERGECFADDALDHLIDTLKGQHVDLVVVGEDQFGRTLAHVFAGDRHINLEMVESGLATASTPEQDDPHGDAILEAEGYAFQAGFGLWSWTACGSEGPTPRVVIAGELSEIDPPGPDDEALGAETIEVLNNGTEPVDLGGWILRDESARHRFVFGGRPGDAVAQDFLLGPGEGFVVASSDTGWEPGGGPVWNNDGDMVLLQLPDGTVVDRWRYP